MGFFNSRYFSAGTTYVLLEGYAPSTTRVAMYRGRRLGTELISIIPSITRNGSEVSGDVDELFAYISTMSPNWLLTYRVVSFLNSSVDLPTRQIGLHSAFLTEMMALCTYGVKLNDLVWIDDITKVTETTNTGSAGAGVSMTVDDASLLGTLVVDQTLLYICDQNSGNGFMSLVKGHAGDTIVIDVPDTVSLGNVVEEEARSFGSGYKVFRVTFGYPRCRYGGQQLPDVAEGSQDMERSSMTYEFISDSLPVGASL